MENVVAILNIGVIGLGFLLAFLAYRLLSNPNLVPAAATNARLFLAFSLVICTLGLASEGMRRWFDSQIMTSSQAATVNDGLNANSAARSYVAGIPGLVERSCPGGSSGQNPANYPNVLSASNSARTQLDVVQSALEICAQLAPSD